MRRFFLILFGGAAVRSAAFFAKPRTVIFYREGGLQGFGARCPSYQAVRWTERGNRVVFSHPEGHCREWNLDAVTFKPWTRVA